MCKEKNYVIEEEFNYNGNNEAELYYWNYIWLYRLDKENKKKKKGFDLI